MFIIFKKNWGIILSIFLIVAAVAMGIKIKSWMAIGSIGTFIMAIATFITLWWYQKEKEARENKEVLEEVIYPLIEDLNSIIENIPKGKIKDLQWRWPNIRIKRHLILKLKIKKNEENIEKEINNFDQHFLKFKDLWSDRENIIDDYISFCAYKVMITGPEDWLENTEESREWYCIEKKEKEETKKTFSEFIFYEETPAEPSNFSECKVSIYISSDYCIKIINLLKNPDEEIKKYCKEENLLKNLKERIKEYTERIKKYVEEGRRVWKAAKNLREELNKELENFKKKII